MLATDLAPSMVALAAANNPSASVRIMDALDIHKLPDEFHGIVCGFVLPYLDQQDARLLLQRCFAKLKQGGHLYLSLIAGSYASSGIQTSSSGDTLMQYFYDAPLVSEMVTTAQFTVSLCQKLPIPAGTVRQLRTSSS